MNREFVILPAFEKSWKSSGLSEDDLAELEDKLLIDPTQGDVVQGTNGLRKLRWARPGMGKSGGVRVFYADFPGFCVLFLVTSIQKNKAENLTKEQKSILGSLVKTLERELK
jgi:mRNA-degrading endonuclease RelE of RelBE toxin-antitoxin system